MRASGSVATGSASDRGIPLPTAPRQRPTVDLVERLEQAHARRTTSGIPTAPQPAPTAAHQCATCGEWVHTVSRRGWCDWCEQQAAKAIAPTEPPAQTGKEIPLDEAPQDDADDEQPVELPDYILDFAILMRDTEGHHDPQIRAARKATANAAMALHRVWTGWQKRQQQAKPAPKPELKRRRAPSPRRTDQAVIDAMVRLYTGEQLTPAQIAERLHVGTSTVQRHLRDSGIPLRDDRKTHSGGRPRSYDDATARDVAHRYVDLEQSATEIAHALHMSTSTIVRLLKAHGVTTRPQTARQPADNAASLRDRMHAAGTTAADVRAWARANRITMPTRGLPSAGVLAAYLNARDSKEGTP